MKAPLEVVTSPRFWRRLKISWMIFAPFAVLGIYAAYQRATDTTGQRETGMVVGLLAIAAFLLLHPLFFVFLRRFWVQWFDTEGVRLRNGQRYEWKDFVKCEPRVSARTRMVNNYDLVFKTGTAGVYHQMTDTDEVMPVLEQLQRGVNPFV